MEFDQPVISYTDNFIDAPVGSAVPTGWYDRVRHAWTPGPDGLVVRIVAVGGGVATLDIDSESGGDPGAETLAELAAGFGITEAEVTAELTRLGGLYPAGAGREFWRVKIEHFTPWDFNWPYGPPVNPRPKLPPLQPFIEDPKYVRKDPCAQAGSIVECETRVLGEEIPIRSEEHTSELQSH